MHILVIVRLTYAPPARPLTAGMRTTNPHDALRTDSHHADHPEK